MKVTEYWLKDIVDFDLTPRQLADALTMVGLEVEDHYASPRNFSHVVVGRIISCEGLPESESLKVCKVDKGMQTVNVVCGAPNVAEGILVPLALPGGRIADGSETQIREIRGIKSEGILCSEAELGLSERSEGLMLLSDDAIEGADLNRALGPQDHVFDVVITPNRPDCMSVLGIAREISAITGIPLRKKKVTVKGTDEKVSDYIKVKIEDVEHCCRYSGRFIKHVKIKPSPYWMVARLHDAGVRSINNIVDITNYVMLETGHPLHAFDYRLLEGKMIIVRSAEQNDNFVTLDGKEHQLDADACLICDAKKSIALAGIMGGLNSEVQSDTEQVFLESAYFDPTNIRLTSKKLAQSTESSRRFERGADPNRTVYALEYASKLIKELAEGQIVGQVIDEYPEKVDSITIHLSVPRTNSLLGTNISKKEIRNILERLEIAVETERVDQLQVKVPTFRPDLTRQVDLIEEIARHYGYDNIPNVTTAPVYQTQFHNEKDAFSDRIRHYLSGMGFRETVSLSLVSPNTARLFLPEKCDAVTLRNSLSVDWSVFRPNLLLSLLNSTVYNKNRQMDNFCIFEIGNAAWRDSAKNIIQGRQVAGLFAGLRLYKTWKQNAERFDFYDPKAAVSLLLRKLNIKGVEQGKVLEGFWDGEAVGLYLQDKTYLGALGKLSANICGEFKIRATDIYAFYLLFDTLSDNREPEKIYDPIPRFPSVPFDLALIVDASIPVGELEKEIKKSGGKYLKKVDLFDFYKGKQVPDDKKSVAFSLTFSSKERTLDDSDVDRAVKNIITHLGKLFGANLRPR